MFFLNNIHKSNTALLFSCFCLSLILRAQDTTCYLVDLKSPLVLQPPDQRGIHFGFTLAHILNNTQRTLLVGAPKATTFQDVDSPGALYSCTLSRDSVSECHQLTVDSRMSEDKYKPWITKDLKGNQRLGYSMAANSDSVVVCAPRWHIYEKTTSGTEDFPLGICFAAKAPEFKFTPFSPSYLTPLSDGKMSFQNRGSCQIGISLAYLKDQDSISLGAPGCWTWQGDTWKVDLDSPEKNYRSVKELSLEDVELTLDESADGFRSIANLYLGYSIATMKYGNINAIVSAMPRTGSTSELRVTDKNLVLGPMVYILEDDRNRADKLTILDTIKPPKNQTQEKEASMESMFSYFGYSLTATDVNGDGLDDVIVGAPFYHNSTRHDQGAIFVYIQTRFPTGGEVPWSYEMEMERQAPRRIGKESYGRFGSCVAAIGDIDSDGYQDIAVGAPYLKEGGAVFLYFGSPDGLEELSRQVIRASHLPDYVQPVSGFGFSISQYLFGRTRQENDLAIGAYSSDVVGVFNFKEVLTLDWNMTFSGQMDLGQDACIITSEGSFHSYPCVQVTVCLMYHKRKALVMTRESLVFSVNLNADINHQPRRLFFENEKPDTKFIMDLIEDTYLCKTLNIMARKDLAEDFRKFEIQGEVSFVKQEEDKVVLDPRTKVTKSKDLDILVSCEGAEAGSCLSELRLDYNVLSSSYNLGSQKEIMVSFTVENSGEPAYNTRLIISSEGDLRVRKDDRNVTCETKNEEDIVCDVGIIFTKDSTMDFNLSMTPSQKFFNSLRNHDDAFHINATLTTSSVIINPDEASKSFQIPIIVDGTLDLTKDSSQTSIVKYNSSSYFKTPQEAEDEEELGPEVLHNYKIFNKNPYDVYMTKVNILWPLKIKGQYMLYLLDMPEFSGAKPTCNYTNGRVDEFGLKTVHELNIQGDFRSSPSINALKLRRNKFGDAIFSSDFEYMEFQCLIGQLHADTEVYIRLRSRLVQTTIKKLEMGTLLGNVSSLTRIQVIDLPLNAPRPPPSPASTVLTVISYINESPEFELPWWVYLVSALAGLLLLIVIILILWKCNFFKRKKAGEVNEDAPEGDTVDGEKTKEDGEEEEDEEEEDEEEEAQPMTPKTPMLKGTENANNDFEYKSSG